MKQLILQSSSTKQTIVDYINASNQVCRYAVSINTVGLPALVTPPDNYGDYAQTLAMAKLHVMKWIDEIVPAFEVIPSSFLTFNNMLQPQLKTIKTNLQTLQKDPNNTTAKTAVTNAVNTLVKQVGVVKSTVTDLDGWITTYQGNISPDAKTLGQLTTSIATAVNADQDAISKLNTAFSTLQSVIDDRNELATLNTVSNIALTIFLAVVGAAVGLPFSPVIGAIAGGVVGITTGVVTLFEPIHNDPDYQQTLKEIQDQMSNISTEIGLLNTTVGLLQNISQKFTDLVANSGQASDQAKVVLSFWQQQETDLTQLVNDLNDILSSTQSGTIDKALADIQDAQNSWNDVINFVENIKDVTYTVDTTNVPKMPPTS